VIEITENNPVVEVQEVAPNEIVVTETSFTIELTGQGAQGIAGQGVPMGGTAGQVLTKIDGVDYNTQWETPDTVITDHTLLSNIGTNTHAQIDSHIASTSNPHPVTKSQVGLGNVDNTSDLNKPISTATQTALNNKSDLGHTHPLSDLQQSGASTNQVPQWNGSAWVPANMSSGVTDHTLLSNIGTNTHAQIDSHIASTSNPHSVTKSQVGLGNVVNLDTSTTANITDSTNKRFVTDANLTVINNTSGTNTGDQDLSGYELLSNKATDLTVLNNTLYPTTQAVQNAINSAVSASEIFMLSGTNSDISGYESMPELSVYTSGALATVSQTVTTSPTLLEEFATNVGYPNVTSIPVGLFTAHFETQKSAGSNNYFCYFQVFKRTSGGTETLLLTSDNSSQSALNTVVQHTLVAFNSSVITLNATDRVVMKVYARMVSSSATITLRWDSNTDARLQLPLSPLGYVPEDRANKSTSTSLGTSDTLYPSQNAVKSYVDSTASTLQTNINNKVNISGDNMTGNLSLPNIIVNDGSDGYIMLQTQSSLPPSTTTDNGVQIYSIDNEHFSIRSTIGIGAQTMSLRLSELTADRILRFRDQDGYIQTDNLKSARIWVGDASNNAQEVELSGAIAIDNVGLTSINDDIITNAMVNDNAQIAGTKLRPTVAALIDAATISVNASGGNQFAVTLGGNRTLGNPTGAYNGQLLLFVIRQDGAGGRTLAADTKYRFNDTFSDFELNSAAGKTTYILCRYHSTDDKFDVLDIRRMD